MEMIDQKKGVISSAEKLAKVGPNNVFHNEV